MKTAINDRSYSSAVAIDALLEIILMSLDLGHNKCIIGAWYRLPGSHPELVDLNEAIDNILNRYPNRFLILGGDFNYPSVYWSSCQVTSHTNRFKCLQFLQSLQFRKLTHHVHEHIRGDHVLDLVLTNQPDLITTRVLEQKVVTRLCIAQSHVPMSRKFKRKSAY